MLTIDGDVSCIPVVTCATRHEERQFEHDIVEFERDSPSRAQAIPMN
jgi:hypothetical protein